MSQDVSTSNSVYMSTNIKDSKLIDTDNFNENHSNFEAKYNENE